MAQAVEKISSLVEDQLPDFIREEGPLFVEFIKAYYKWLERDGNNHSELRNLNTYQDLDTTNDLFFEHIREEIARAVPKNSSVNQTLFLKKIRDIYRAKGSEDAFKILFRALYNEEIELYYPEDNILRTSFGKWSEERSIRLTNLSSSNTDIFAGKIVTGMNTNAKGRVERIVRGEEYGINITELYLSSIVGTFEDGERVYATGNTISGTIFNDTGSIQEVVIQFPGEGHVTGDAVSLLAASGSGANGVISSTTDRSLIRFELKNGGSGYTTNAEITITSTFGQGATFTIDTISNTEIITQYTDTIFALKDVPLNTGPTFSTGGANSATLSANLASANVTTTLGSALGTANVTVGTINSISTTNQGFGYTEFPTITVREPLIADLRISDGAGGYKGENAVIVANTVPGAINSIRVNAIGSSYSKFEPVTVQNNSRSGTVDATAAPLVSGFLQYPGRYINERGRPSGYDRLQDGSFYQKFSYVIRSRQFIDSYRQTVTELLHPAGTKLFGEVVIALEPEVPTITAALESFIIDRETITTIDVPTIVTESESQYAANGITSVFSWDPELSATMPTLSVENDVTVYALANGTISIEAQGTINTYATALISVYANTQIQALGNPKFVSGVGTTFTTNIANNSTIIIVDNDGVIANSAYVVSTVSSNTGLLLVNAYENAPLANGSYYYIV